MQFLAERKFDYGLGLSEIAGADDRVIKASNFEEIGKIANSLLIKVCRPVPGER